ncbi:hypothetical protein BFP97_08140 [Roseivirga sp. 4D4]|nr:hypothetical protein BFP97_08140 [Roseivirga sp. 4D4]
MVLFNLGQSQDSPFKNISKTESEFNSGNIAARMVEGLGFRYYWASEGLRAEDLEFDPVEEGRSSRQTIDHIYSLSRFLLSALENEVFDAGNAREMSFEEVRTETLENFEKAVKILKGSESSDFADYNIKFANGVGFPFWNAINGPISDAIYHTGQVVLMRRMSGNPINPNISVLSGSIRGN